MRLIMNAGHEHFVYGKMVRGSEEFEAPDGEAQTWIKLGWARHKEDPIKRGPGRPRKDEIGRYDRRDMRAEDE